MSHRTSDDESADYGDAPSLQPAPPAHAPPIYSPAPQAPSLQPAARADSLRSSILKKPLDANTFGGPVSSPPPGYPPKFR